MIVRRLALAVFALATAGCSQRELALWIDWHEQDPAAAEAFANQPHIQAALTDPGSDDPQFDAASVWARVAWCETGGDWAYNGGSGYDGGLQFHPDVWRTYGGGDFAAYAWQASRTQQITVAERILADVGWGAWPACSRKLGLR